MSAESHKLEEGDRLTLDFAKIAAIAQRCAGVIPVAVQDAASREVILLAYTNQAAMRKAFATRTLILWSTSRNVLWEKGASSGESFELLEARVNCEQNSLLYIVRPRRAGICHTRNAQERPRSSCYYRRIDLETEHLTHLDP